jgi:hypothetical protein
MSPGFSMNTPVVRGSISPVVTVRAADRCTYGCVVDGQYFCVRAGMGAGRLGEMGGIPGKVEH